LLRCGADAAAFRSLPPRGVRTAKQLINAPTVSDGYTALWERHRLDLTVEAELVGHPKWHPLFKPEEVERAHKRLIAYGYKQ
jgi:hypothetical protein